MIKINIVCIGNLKEKYYRDSFFEYSKRLKRYCKFTVDQLDECKLPQNSSAAEIEEAIKAEGKSILSKLHSSFIIALCIEGKMFSSEELSDTIDKLSVQGISEISFVIGGSWGLSDEIKNRANIKLSMSRMTFPHQLARIMLCEQIYRAFQISNNGKYHK